MPDRGLMGLFGMLPQEAEAMPRGLFAPDPDLEWLVDQVRKARLAEELRAAGFNPDVTPGQALREFAVTAPVELAMAAFLLRGSSRKQRELPLASCRTSA